MPTRQENALTNPQDKTTGFVNHRDIQASNNQRLTQSQFQLDKLNMTHGQLQVFNFESDFALNSSCSKNVGSTHLNTEKFVSSQQRQNNASQNVQGIYKFRSSIFICT